MVGLAPARSDRAARLAASPLRHLDPLLLGSVLAINVLGLLMVYSATRNGLIGGITDPLFYVKRQAVFVVIGLGVMAAAILIDYRRMREWAPVI